MLDDTASERDTMKTNEIDSLNFDSPEQKYDTMKQHALQQEAQLIAYVTRCVQLERELNAALQRAVDLDDPSDAECIMKSCSRFAGKHPDGTPL